MKNLPLVRANSLFPLLKFLHENSIPLENFFTKALFPKIFSLNLKTYFLFTKSLMRSTLLLIVRGLITWEFWLVKN